MYLLNAGAPKEIEPVAQDLITEILSGLTVPLSISR